MKGASPYPPPEEGELQSPLINILITNNRKVLTSLLQELKALLWEEMGRPHIL
jgi:hypothetical protein